MLLLISLYVFAETAEEEKQRLLQEKEELEVRLQEIEGGKYADTTVEELAANTTYSELIIDNSTTFDDLVPIELKCGDYELYNKNSLIDTNDFYFVLWNGTKVKLIDLVGKSLPIKAVYAENYNCDDIGYY